MGNLIRFVLIFFVGIAVGFYFHADIEQYLKKVSGDGMQSRQPLTVSTASVSKTINKKNLRSPQKSTIKSQSRRFEKPVSLTSAEVKILFTIQVGAFAKKDQAQKFIDQLHQEEIDAYIAPSDLVKNRGMYRVWVGEYLHRHEAEVRLKELVKRFQGAFIQSF
jgi:cell division septation protein DedD